MNQALPPSRPLLVDGITKSFEGARVLDDVSLSVEAGASLALLGPSGCGKTTLLRTIAGLERPDAGQVRLGDVTLSARGVHVPPERRRIGMVFQDWALFPHLDVASNVAYGLGRDDAARRRVDETLEMVGLAGLGGRMPATLSGGQQQRVAIARAVAPRPAAILLDEPFSNLDAALRVKVRADTKRLLREIGMTSVFVTHDQGEAFVMGDQVAVMRDGVVLQQDRPADIYARPVDPWVAAFVGEANLLDVAATGHEAESVIGRLPLEGRFSGRCRVLVRPEQVTIGPGDAGEVVGVEFYGHDTSYRVAVPGGGEMVVRAIAAPRFAPGDRVTLGYEGPPALAFGEELAVGV